MPFCTLTAITVTNNGCRCRLFWLFVFFAAPVGSFHHFYAIALVTGKIALTITEDPLIGTVLHNEWFTLKPVSFLSVYGPLAFIAIWLIATLVIIIKTAVLLIQKLRKKQIKGGLWTHLLPLLQIMSLGLFIWGFIGVATVDLLADNRFISGLIAYGTVLFLLISTASVIWFLIKRENNYNYYQSLVYSFMNLTIGIYFTVMGVTGFHFF